jgi:acyl carrier protein
VAVTTDGGRAVRREACRFGPLGYRERIEPILRSIVADRLGVPSDDLLPDVSFEQDLAALPSDVTELVVAIEQVVGLHLSESAIERMRTYGDLIDAVLDARAGTGDGWVPRVLLRTVLVPARRDRRGVVVRSAWSTPYALGSIVDEARRAGSGACLVVTLPGDAAGSEVAAIERAFASLARQGVTLRVHREQDVRGRAVA